MSARSKAPPPHKPPIKGYRRNYSHHDRNLPGSAARRSRTDRGMGRPALERATSS